jgi:hypothetical protein
MTTPPSDDPPSERPEGPPVPATWWPEIVDLIEHVEAEAARREGRRPRSPAEICAAIDAEWWWRP